MARVWRRTPRPAQHGFAGLSLLGWIGFGIMWIAQAIVFWRGMDSIRKFIDFCGPAVYVVMFLLAGYLVIEAGWENIDFNLADGGITLTGWAVLPVLLSAIALVVSYFSGPMLNYGDFARYGKSFAAVKKGNFLGSAGELPGVLAAGGGHRGGDPAGVR